MASVLLPLSFTRAAGSFPDLAAGNLQQERKILAAADAQDDHSNEWRQFRLSGIQRQKPSTDPELDSTARTRSFQMVAATTVVH
jgi:hypothetical protein